MTWYPDLGPCGYFEFGLHQAQAVGWLAKDESYRIGPVEVSLVVGLETIRSLRYEPLHYLGWHECELCLDEGSGEGLRSSRFTPWRLQPLGARRSQGVRGT